MVVRILTLWGNNDLRFSAPRSQDIWSRLRPPLLRPIQRPVGLCIQRVIVLPAAAKGQTHAGVHELILGDGDGIEPFEQLLAFFTGVCCTAYVGEINDEFIAALSA